MKEYKSKELYIRDILFKLKYKGKLEHIEVAYKVVFSAKVADDNTIPFLEYEKIKVVALLDNENIYGKLSKNCKDTIKMVMELLVITYLKKGKIDRDIKEIENETK